MLVNILYPGTNIAEFEGLWFLAGLQPPMPMTPGMQWKPANGHYEWLP